MNAPKLKDRLQPCLFDRLLDDTPALDSAKARLQALQKRRQQGGSDPENFTIKQLDERIGNERLLVRELEERLGRPVITEQQLRASVLRDLAWLLGTASLESVQELDDYPEVKSSVVNFGLRGLTGWNASHFSPARLEVTVREAIQRFEPRILAKYLSVTVESARFSDDPKVLTIEIKGQLWGQPLPQALYLKSLLDLETGDVKIMQGDAG